MTGIQQQRPSILFLDEESCRDETLVGGKAFGLANLAGRFRVPPGFCISSEALSAFRPHELFPEALRRSVQKAYRLLGEKCGEDNPSVAIRSSAIGEDSATASFAGIHETYLNVKGAERVVNAVKDCVASAFSERALEYRRRTLDTRDPQVAVIVQKLVPAEAAAVAFTTNPITGSPDELVVNATLGLGETLVGGRSTPDTYVLRRADRAIIHRKISDKVRMLVPASTGTQEADVPAHLRSSPALTDDQLSEVVELALKVEDAVGRPVDIEAAWAAGQLFLLQARPVTTGFPATLEGEDAKLEWEREVGHFPALTPPLEADALQKIFDGADLRFRDDGKPIRLRCRIFNGQVYLALQWLVFEADIPRAQEKVDEVNRAKARELARYWRDTVMPRLIETYSWMQHTPIETLSPTDLGVAWRELWQRVEGLWAMHWGLTGPSRKSLEDLVTVYTTLFPEASPAEALTLVQGLSRSLNLVQSDLYALASLARSFPGVSELIKADHEDTLSRLEAIDGGQEFQRKFNEFLKTHGHLGHLDTQMLQPAWEDEPSLVIGEVRRFLTSETPDPEIEQKRLAEEAMALAKRRLAQLRGRQEDLARLEEALLVARQAGPLSEEHNYWLDRMLITRERQFVLRVADRLVKMSVISQPKDIFFLYIDEVAELILRPQDARAKITARQKTLAEWKRLRAPPHLGKRHQPEDAGLSARQAGVEDHEVNVLRGESASLGVARGHARIVLKKEDFQRVKSGDIMVCHETNPTWVSLFSVAGGLVTDEGGVLSHAAVIAREFGLPAVVGVKEATLRLRDDQLVEVDGSSGRVRIIEENFEKQSA